MGAIALTSAIGFTACSSDDSATADVNPTYDGTSVRTDFAFNVTKASQDTRMSGTNTQESGNFLGMKRMFLLPFNVEPEANKTTNANIFYLGNLTDTEISSEPSKKIYALTLPVGTNNFLFYGTSAASGTNFQKGIVSSNFWSVSGDVETPSGSSAQMNTDNIYFELTSIANNLGTDATNIAAYLTAIANTTGWKETTTTAQTDGTYSALAKLYNQFISDLTQYAGSAEAIKRLILDLYKSAKAINANSSVTAIQTIANAICTSIDTDKNGLKITITASDANPDNWTATFTGFTDEQFPSGVGDGKLNLPMGAAQLEWNSNKFQYRVDASSNPSTNLGTTTTAAITDYRYPAEIIYFDNSPLIATNQYKQVSDYPKTCAKWDAVHGTDGAFDNTWTQQSVAADTRAVAMTNNVNYGVALLETTVKLEKAYLKDNMKGIIKGDAEDQTINVVTNNNDKSIADKKSIFKVTGVLVGGQPAQVGWNMISSTTDYNSVIYDNDVTFKETALSTSPTAENYTVVFDNYATTGDQKDVLIALEIVNDGCDFYGAEGLIPAGNTFYLLGKLQLTHSTNNWSGENAVKANRPTTYRITEEGTKRVFVQDYKTIANLTLKDDALKRAYSAIPDLRATEVLFGLSVDLKWVSGLQFNVDM